MSSANDPTSSPQTAGSLYQEFQLRVVDPQPQTAIFRRPDHDVLLYAHFLEAWEIADTLSEFEIATCSEGVFGLVTSPGAGVGTRHVHLVARSVIIFDADVRSSIIPGEVVSWWTTGTMFDQVLR